MADDRRCGQRLVAGARDNKGSDDVRAVHTTFHPARGMGASRLAVGFVARRRPGPAAGAAAGRTRAGGSLGRAVGPADGDRRVRRPHPPACRSRGHADVRRVPAPGPGAGRATAGHVHGRRQRPGHRGAVPPRVGGVAPAHRPDRHGQRDRDVRRRPLAARRRGPGPVPQAGQRRRGVDGDDACAGRGPPGRPAVRRRVPDRPERRPDRGAVVRPHRRPVAADGGGRPRLDGAQRADPALRGAGRLLHGGRQAARGERAGRAPVHAAGRGRHAAERGRRGAADEGGADGDRQGRRRPGDHDVGHRPRRTDRRGRARGRCGFADAASAGSPPGAHGPGGGGGR